MKEEILAQLNINNYPKFTKKQQKRFIVWLKDKLSEFKKEKDRNIFAKNYKAKLYK